MADDIVSAVCVLPLDWAVVATAALTGFAGCEVADVDDTMRLRLFVNLGFA